jgi:8-hydroxy-5-deazaflavin:NADPH oxidoreductase
LQKNLPEHIKPRNFLLVRWKGVFRLKGGPTSDSSVMKTYHRLSVFPVISKQSKSNQQMKIGIIGSGIVGRVLASAFLKENNEVMLGTRDTSKDEVVQWVKENTTGRTGNFNEVAAFAEVVVLAVAGTVAEEALQLSGLENLKGKVIIDATNPIAPVPPENGVLKFFTTLDDSLMERLQRLAPEARFVKAFSSVGNALMYKPRFAEGRPTMFICGNDSGAKHTVTDILNAFGWDTADMGGVQAARAIEPLCILWCIPGFLQNQWNHAFKLLK